MATIAIGIDKGSGSYTCRVPVNSLAEGGVPPEEGDSVEYSVSGTVQSVSGSEATIKIDAINGEPVSEEASESPEEEAAEPEGPGAGGGAGGPPTPGGAAALGARLKKGTRGLPLPAM